MVEIYPDDARRLDIHDGDMTPEDMDTLLSVLIGGACEAFEKLPLERDLHLMRSILYAGVWQKFNETYRKKDTTDAPSERIADADDEREHHD